MAVQIENSNTGKQKKLIISLIRIFGNEMKRKREEVRIHPREKYNRINRPDKKGEEENGG